MQVFTDKARSQLLSISGTTLQVVDPSQMPHANRGAAADLVSNTWFKLVLTDHEFFEIVYVMSHTGSGVMTVQRARDGTAEREWVPEETFVIHAPVASDHARFEALVWQAPQDASTSAKGIVQLNNTLTSTSVAQALTAAQGRQLKQELDAPDKTHTRPLLVGVKEQSVDMGAGSAINAQAGNVFYKTISANVALSVTGVAASGMVTSFILDLSVIGSRVVTWWTGIAWASGSPPTLTKDGRDVLGFYTRDAGASWTGLVLAKNLA